MRGVWGSVIVRLRWEIATGGSGTLLPQIAHPCEDRMVSIMRHRSAVYGLLLFLLAAGVRVAWVVVRHGPAPTGLTFPDEEAYWQSARSLAAGHGLVDEFGYRATYMPGYPVFLALWTTTAAPLQWARLVQAVLGGLAAPAVFFLTQSVVRRTKSRGDEVGLLAGALAAVAVAFDPFLVFFSGLLLTETLFTMLLVPAWWLVMRRTFVDSRGAGLESVLVGLLLLLCILLRPASVALVLVTPIAIVLFAKARGPAVRHALIIAIVVLAGLVPWGWRNQRVLGEWRWLTTRGGISLYDGLRPGASGASDLAHTKSMPEVAGLNEIAWDAYFRQQARLAVRDDPLRVVRLAGRKFLRTWSLTPNVEAYQRGTLAWVSAIWMIAVLVSAAVGWWRVRRSPGTWLLLLLPVGVFTSLHMVFVGSVRYRVPVMPMVYVLAGIGLAGLIRVLAIQRADQEPGIARSDDA